MSLKSFFRIFLLEVFVLTLVVFVSCGRGTSESSSEQPEDKGATQSLEKKESAWDNDSPTDEQTTDASASKIPSDSLSNTNYDKKNSTDLKGTPTIEPNQEEGNDIVNSEENTSLEKNEIAEEKEASIEVEKAPDFHAHAVLDGLLKKYVSSAGVVNYNGMKAEQASLKSYLEEMANNAPVPDWTRKQKLAYWINLYNAGTLDLILDNYPLKSIMDLDKPWDQQNITSGSQKLSLNDIENKIIRPTFKEPRIHFAVNCAAKSCPKLLNEAFVPEKLESQLETSAKYFINNKYKNNIAENSVYISKIFEWYAEDFGGKEGLIDYLNKYSHKEINDAASIKFMEYDWKLNE